MNRGKLFIVSAPSGTGKTTLINELLKRWNQKKSLKMVVTYTTRAKRDGEQDGIDYHFISESDFIKKIEANFFLEWSTWYNAYYGSPVSIIDDLKKGISYIAILDRVGAQKIKELYAFSILIWIEPPSLEILKERLEKRAKDNKTVIEERLKKAAIEIEQEKRNVLYDFHIINDDFEKTVHTLNIFLEIQLKK